MSDDELRPDDDRRPKFVVCRGLDRHEWWVLGLDPDRNPYSGEDEWMYRRIAVTNDREAAEAISEAMIAHCPGRRWMLE